MSVGKLVIMNLVSKFAVKRKVQKANRGLIQIYNAFMLIFLTLTFHFCFVLYTDNRLQKL